MGTESDTKMIFISHETCNAWTHSLSAVLDSALGAQTVHLDGDDRYDLDQRLSGPVLIVICDADYMRALETVQRWRRHHPDEPLLVVTPERDEERLVRIYQAGADECIHTSVGLPLLLAKLRVWMRWVVIEPDHPLLAG